jgi:hypothetical protein
MCLSLSKKLIDILSQSRMAAIAVGCDLDAIRAVFPIGDEAELKRRTYTLVSKG